MNEVLKMTPVPAYASILMVVWIFGCSENDNRPGSPAPSIDETKMTKMLATERGRLKPSITKEHSSALLTSYCQG